MRARANGQRHVYVAHWGDWVKIGMSEDPPRRVANLSSGPLPMSPPGGQPELLGYVEGGIGAEKLLQAALAQWSIGGEWFRLGPPVQAVADQVQLARFGNSKGPVAKRPSVYYRPRPVVIYPHLEYEPDPATLPDF
jgi:hypothetical protein